MADEHRFETCRDKDCPRLTCIAYRAGFEDGYEDGFADGVRACQNTDAS